MIIFLELTDIINNYLFIYGSGTTRRYFESILILLLDLRDYVKSTVF